MKEREFTKDCIPAGNQGTSGPTPCKQSKFSRSRPGLSNLWLPLVYKKYLHPRADSSYPDNNWQVHPSRFSVICYNCSYTRQGTPSRDCHHRRHHNFKTGKLTYFGNNQKVLPSRRSVTCYNCSYTGEGTTSQGKLTTLLTVLWLLTFLSMFQVVLQ